jgi:hypothetical protein
MLGRRMLGVILAIAATSLVAMPTAAQAKAMRLDLTWEGEGGPVHKLEPGEAVDLLLSSFSVQTRSGGIECSTDFGVFPGLGGLDETNDETTDKVKLDFVEGVIGGEAGCAESAPDSSPVTVFLDPDDSILNLSGSKGRATIKAASSTEPISLALEYQGGLACHYDANKLAGALKVAEPFPGNVSLTFEKQKLKLDKPGSGAECSRSASLDAHFDALVTTEDVSAFEGGPEILGQLER